jgi:hypothetical protein
LRQRRTVYFGRMVQARFLNRNLNLNPLPRLRLRAGLKLRKPFALRKK